MKRFSSINAAQPVKQDEKEYHKTYYQEHREERLAYGKVYHQAHKEERQAYDRTYSKTHRETKRANDKTYRQAHRGKRRAKELKRIYNITQNDYDNILAAQNGVCAICHKPFMGNKRIRFLHIDHDHSTGQVRGLLCLHCNVVLGFIENNSLLLPEIKKYLIKHRP